MKAKYIMPLFFLQSILYISCQQPKPQEMRETDDKSKYNNSLIHTTPSIDTTTIVSVKEDTKNVSEVVKPKPVDYYDKGYSIGFDNGREDAVMVLGDGWSYDDSNPYTGKARHDYERGYRKGYRDGYKDGFYNYSYGDEDEYDEYD